MAEYTIVQIKRDSTLNWYASNPRLALGEPGVDMDLHRFKIGNGIDRWNELPYMDDDLYKLLDKQQQATADYVQNLLNKIAANKLDADQKYNALTSELRNTSRSLTERMTAVETEQTEYQENLTERQQEFEEAVTGDFEDTKSEVQAGLDEFNETRDSLTVRMNAIAGQATEDTEILDARVDVGNRTHPNLGENIRNIHSEVLSVKQSGAKEKEERIAVDDIERTARITADETEKAERIAADEAERTERTAAYEAERTERITADEQHEAGIAKLSDDTEKLSEHGEFLQEQINDTAGGMLKTAILLSEEIQRTREETARRDAEKTSEQQAREAGDSTLSVRIDSECRERVAEDERLSTIIDAQGRELKHERLSSAEISGELKRRIDKLSEAVTEGALLFVEEDEKLKAERADREKADEVLSRVHNRREDYLQEQTDDLACLAMSEILQNREKFQAVQEDIQLEAHTRNKIDAQIRERITEVDETHSLKIDALDNEVKDTRRNLQEEKAQRGSQADEISDAVLGLTVEHVIEHEKRVEAEKELSERIDGNNDELSEKLRHEEQARKAFDSRIEKEIQPVAEGLICEGLDRYEAHSRQQSRLEHDERLGASRYDFQNEQINDLASMGMEHSMNLHQERKMRRADTQALHERINNEEQARKTFEAQVIEQFANYIFPNLKKDETLHEQMNDVVNAVLYAMIDGYRARGKLKARIKVMEEVLMNAGFLDEGDIPMTTETEIDSMIEDIFSGNTSGSTVEPENEEEAEFLEDINNIFYP